MAGISHGIRRGGRTGLEVPDDLDAVVEKTCLTATVPAMQVFHAGAGSSMCCIQGGRSVDTTMGMTPLEG